MTDMRDRIAALPLWRDKVLVQPLTGGLTNANFMATDGHRRLMVRIGEDLPFHHVFRDLEVAASRAAHAAGVAPGVIHAEPGLTVFEFIEGRTYGFEDVKANRLRLADLLKRVHRDVAAHFTGRPAFFWVFHVIRDYGARLLAAGGRGTAEVPGYLAVARRLEAAQVPMPIVFGHHDLLPGNILDDGKTLWLVDWEYGGYGTPMFDLANLSGNAEFDRAEEIDLLTAYFGAEPDEALLAAFDAMKTASVLREAMWSMVSERTMNAPDADYPAWTATNLARYHAALAAFEDRHR
jgi:thiamine kinase-like enzyme